jgi:flotillin
MNDLLNGTNGTVVVIVGLGFLALIFILGVITSLYRKAGPNEALIVYGFRGPRVVKGHGTVIFPMVESCRQLSLELMSFDVAPQAGSLHQAGRGGDRGGRRADQGAQRSRSFHSDRGRAVPHQDADQMSAKNLIRLVMEGHLRGIIGQLTVEQIVKEPEMVGERMRSAPAPTSMSKMGLEVISFTIKEVRDKNEYISNMGRPDVARIKRDADVATAEAERDTAILRANALREAAVNKAKADQERVIAETALRHASRPRHNAIWTSRRPSTVEQSRRTAGAGRQGLRVANQRDAAAGDRRAGEGAAGGKRRADQGAGGRDSAQ